MLFKKICIITANRSDYAKLRMLVRMLNSDSDIDLHIIASGSMSSSRHGNAAEDILLDGIKPDYMFDTCMDRDDANSILTSMGVQMIKESQALNEINPDLAIVVGDRWDIIPSVVCCGIRNTPIAHIQGGEQSGNIDGVLRHVITKFSHIHFVSNDDCMKYLLGLGEFKERIHVVGCPSIDFINSIDVGTDINLEEFKPYLKSNFILSKNEGYIVVILHPNATDHNDIDADEVFRALNEFPIKKVCFYPNNDEDNETIVASMRKQTGWIKFSHLPMDLFIKMMAHCSCMVGNSSAGIRETACFGVPTINIGERQCGRMRNKNTIDVDCNFDNIVAAISKALDLKRVDSDNVYGSGDSVSKIFNIIKNYKKFSYKNIV